MVQMNSVKMVYDSSGTEALHGVDLDIHDGEFVFLVGPSGSGKTTIIKLLTGEVHASSGEITVNGFDMMRIKRRKLPFLRRTLGVIFQDFRLIDKMTVYDNVAFAMRVVGAGNAAIKERVPYVLLLGEDWVNICNAVVQTYIDQDTTGLFFSADEGGFTTVDEATSFYLNEDGSVTLVFPEYTIAAGAAGIVEIPVAG